MLEALQALLKKLGIDFTGKEDQLKAEIEKLVNSNSEGSIDPGKIDTSKMDKETKALFNTVIEMVKSQQAETKNLQTLLQKEQEERQKGLEATQARAKADKDAKVKDAVEKLFTGKKITEAQKEHYQKLFEADFDSASKVADSLPVIGGADKKDSSNGESQNQTIKSSLETGDLLGVIQQRNQSAVLGEIK